LPANITLLEIFTAAAYDVLRLIVVIGNGHDHLNNAIDLQPSLLLATNPLLIVALRIPDLIDTDTPQYALDGQSYEFVFLDEFTTRDSTLVSVVPSPPYPVLTLLFTGHDSFRYMIQLDERPRVVRSPTSHHP
jgi:hypothetical protein